VAPRPVVISTVAGTAGVGKTALAVRWAHRVAEAFPDGQLYVNLRGYDLDRPVTAGDALAGFLRALGVVSADIPLEESERAARYRSLVHGKRLLMVLDNAAAEEQVRPLLPGSGSVMVVVTSRDSLAGLVARDGAHRLDLDLLPQGEAVALLGALIGERAEADPAATEALAGLCARLPLALRVAAESAASRPDTPLAELAAELAEEGDRLALLDAGGDPRGAVASVFSWSYQQLPEDAARMFRLLGLHPGTDWDRYAVAALTDASLARAGRLLGLLARAHVIQPSGLSRFGMHDLLRAYGADLAVAHDSRQARQAALTRLFDYYLAACAAAMNCLAPAERHRRPDPPQTETPVPKLDDRATALAWLDAELPALIAIAAYTAAHGWPGHTIRVAATLHRYLDSGHDTQGLTIDTHALDAARAIGDRSAQASMLTSLGVFHGRGGRYAQAADHHREALALARECGDRITEARALGNLALIHDQRGDYRQAADHHQQALAIFRELNDLSGEAIILSNLGLVYVRQGRYQQAAGHTQQAITLHRRVGHRFSEAVALTNLGEIRYRQGRYEEAADHQAQALIVSGEIGDHRVRGWALARLGKVRHRQGLQDQAIASHKMALELFREVSDRDGEAEALNGAGETLLDIGQPSHARDSHRPVIAIKRAWR
jgi:tetratricopeptide (TPR) repeat protein